jgi:hypothetical protein
MTVPTSIQALQGALQSMHQQQQMYGAPQQAYAMPLEPPKAPAPAAVVHTE